MTVSHLPGTLRSQGLVGSAPAGHAASRLASGSLARARVPDLRAGTLVAPSGLVPQAPPTTPQWTFISITLNPTAIEQASLSLSQDRRGTISFVNTGTNGISRREAVGGWVLPGLGSFRFNNYISGNASPGAKGQVGFT